ncbi:MAG: gamma-glutamyltransferase [Actinobacteria bacterium]|nr:MAG: gamma-glutamyltransferase [Actinomycetota bacterium]
MTSRAVIAAGHPLTAEAGARVLREGGNAVDAAVAAVLASAAAEPLLTGLGAGGYLLVAGPDVEPTVLDFFVAAPGRDAHHGDRVPLEAVDVDFGDAVQVFNVGPASCGVPGVPAGLALALERWGSVALADLAAPAARLAREGVTLNAQQAFIAFILQPIMRSTPECAALWAPGGRLLQEGDVFRNEELADMLELLGREGAEPFYDGPVGQALADWVSERGGLLTRADMRAYEVVPRAPAHVSYRDRTVMTNPPPSAGGILLAYALGRLDRDAPSPPALRDVLAAMEAARAERTPQFTDELDEPGFLERFLGSRLGATTHLSVLDGDGMAASVTCTNGEGSGVLVPGTGIQINNIMGEEDLSPLGFHHDPPGRHMPSMMAPTLVLHDGEVELVLGSAGSNRIRSALLQTIVGAVDHGLDARAAVEGPRMHVEAGHLYVEPGVPLEELGALGYEVVRFRSPNVFFGGVQAIRRDPRTGEVTGAGDPRRGGVAVVV